MSSPQPSASKTSRQDRISGFIDHQNRIIVAKSLERIAAHDIAQVIGLPPVAAQNGLLSPRARIARRLRPHSAYEGWLLE